MKKKTLSMAILSIVLISGVISTAFILSVKSEEERPEDIPIIDTNERSYSIFRLFLGVNNHLRYAEADAYELFQAISNWGKLARDTNLCYRNVMVTNDTINSWFDFKWLNGGPPQEGDVVIVYFAGDAYSTAPHSILLANNDPYLPSNWRNNLRKISAKIRAGFIFDTCYGACHARGILGTMQHDIYAIGPKDTTPDSWTIFHLRASYTYRRLLPAFADDGTNHTRADLNKDGITTMGELLQYTTGSAWGYEGDDDGDGRLDEDDVNHIEINGYIEHAEIDDDGDGNIDEDPAPKYVDNVVGYGAVGGVVVPVDKFGLLAPYIGLASTILVATVATAVYVKRVKHRKEKQ